MLRLSVLYPVSRDNCLAGAVSRRDLFRGRVQEPPAVNVTSSLNPFHQRLRTLFALQQLPVSDSSLSAPVPIESGFANLNVSASCSACRACARACPSGALVLKQDEDKQHFQLTFTLQACLACDVCAHVCPEQGITLTRETTLSQILDGPPDQILCEGPLAQCTRCNGAFAAHSMEDGHCSVCAFRRRNSFTSHMPGAVLGAAASSEKA